MNQFKEFLASLVLLGATAVHAQSGGEGSKGGGGGDVALPTSRARWFDPESERPIRYCMAIDPGFGMKADAIQPLVERAYRQWQDYYDARIGMNLGRKAKGSLALLPACDESEDLKLYFGGSNQDVLRARAQYANPFSLAERTALGKDFWGRGFLWFANPNTVKLGEGYLAGFPNWAYVKDQLYAALLHELGHVFGHGHVPGTIMREDYWRVLADSDFGHRTRIDHERELMRFWESSVNLEGKIQVWNKQVTGLVRQITGTDLAPGAGIRLTAYGDQYLYLYFETTQGWTRHLIRKVSHTGRTEIGDPVFKSPDGRAYRSRTVVYSGQIQTDSGSKYAVQVEYNMNHVQRSNVGAPWMVYGYDGADRVHVAEFFGQR